jgi:hypothetical protein
MKNLVLSVVSSTISLQLVTGANVTTTQFTIKLERFHSLMRILSVRLTLKVSTLIIKFQIQFFILFYCSAFVKIDKELELGSFA